MSYKNEIGARFDKALSALQISNKEISEVFNTSSQNISNLKKSDRLNDLMSRISIQYDININWLMTGQGEMLISSDRHINSLQNSNNCANSFSVKKTECRLENIEILIQNLIDYYGLKNMSGLAKKLSVSQSVISNWKSRNAIGALVEKVNEVNPEALSCLFEKDTQINHISTEDTYGIDKQNLIKKVCDEFEITQKELADIIGIDDGTVRKWASGATKTPLWAENFIQILFENRQLKADIKVLLNAQAIAKKYL